MNPDLKSALRRAFYASLFTALAAVPLVYGLTSTFLVHYISAFGGAAAYFAVQAVFLAAAYGFSGSRFLSAGVVIYRALYAYVLKYAVLALIFVSFFKFSALPPLPFLTSFIAALLLQIFLSLGQGHKT